ncbi:uncharacterized protein LOC113859332 [Abrus precatorius]|uniref:Uncharacterized protein LOC113859332 n=1 Tax=Abrus precatorius TaxID=3816 RepID=A0A8B8KX65_ABRPR|nr:uncharacterized protein LOC113859332 [Abrus precatorius]
MATSKRLFNLSSLLMATLFAYSASVQLNDPDWYVWFPLYSCACLINLTNCIISTKLKRLIAKIVLWVGILLHMKVVFEDFVHELAGFWSLDLSERVVREKIGSLLVVISSILQMEASKVQNDISSIVKYGEILEVEILFDCSCYRFVKCSLSTQGC